MTFQLKGPERARPVHQIERLLPRHFKILDLVAAGHNTNAIAEIVGMSRAAVGLIVRSPLFQAELARRRSGDLSTVAALDREAILGKARSILERSAEAAATKQVDLLLANDPAIQLRASTNILDRVLGATESKGPVLNISITAEQVALLNLAMKESSNAQQVTVLGTNSAASNGLARGPSDVHEDPGDGPGDE